MIRVKRNGDGFYLVAKVKYTTRETLITIPIDIRVKKIMGPDMYKHQAVETKELRNTWCHANGINCSQFGARPCCPPNIPLFKNLKPRTYMYLVMVKMNAQDWLDTHPAVAAASARDYFTMQGMHVLSRNINKKICDSLHKNGDQGFKVGGCAGCPWKKSGTCPSVCFALEGTGIDVCELSQTEFNIPIKWWDKSVKNGVMEHILAVGGLYSNQELTPENFRKAILEVTHE